MKINVTYIPSETRVRHWFGWWTYNLKFLVAVWDWEGEDK